MIATLARGVKSIGLEAKLAQALAEIRRLDQRRAELEHDLDARVPMSLFDERLRAAAAKYQESNAADDLRSLIIEELIHERAVQKSAIAAAEKRYDVPGEKFRKEYPQWREILLKACRLKLQIASAEFERILADERGRLGDDFPEEELLHSPVVRRVNHVVDSLKEKQRQIEGDLAQVCWQNHAAWLLSD